MTESESPSSELVDCVANNTQTRTTNVATELFTQDGEDTTRSGSEDIVGLSINDPSINTSSIYDPRIYDPRIYDPSVVDHGLSEGPETRGSLATKQIAFTVEDSDKEWHGVEVHLDSGSEHSYISPETAELFGLKQYPLLKKDKFALQSPLNQFKVEVTHWVKLNIKCKRLGLKTVEMCPRVLKAIDPWEILVGRLFMNKHELWSEIGKLKIQEDRREVLGALKDNRTKDEKTKDKIAHDLQMETASALAKNWETSSSSKGSMASSSTNLKEKSSSISSQSLTEAQPKGGA